MRAKLGWSLVWGAVLVGCFAAPTRRAAAANCALYARAVTGVYLYGAAGGWWDEAAQRYQRGQVPQIGSILVFRRTGQTPSGHVAVVSKVISANEILVDHANWYRGRVSRDMPVIDTSADHDWTSVAVLDLGSGKFGRDNPTYGFVYPETGPREIVAGSGPGLGGFDPYVAAGRANYDPDRQAALFHFAVAEDYRRARGRRAPGAAATGYSVRLVAAAPRHGRSAARARHSGARAARAPASRLKTGTSETNPHHPA